MPNEISIKVNQKVGDIEEGSKVTGVEIGELHIHLLSQPELQADWEKLITRTHQLLSTIRDTIGDNIRLPRTAYIEQITQNFREHKVILITGESGCGKTVIAKSWTETVAASNSLLWWDASDFEKDRFEDLGRGLQHSLKEILAAASGETAYVVIDGLDRLFKPGSFRNIVLLLNLLHLDQDISLWRVLVTCQSEELQRVLKALRDVNISITNWHVINVERPSLEEVEPIWQKFPKLQSLLSNERLQPLLILPKHLDIIVTDLNTFPDTRQWVGESDFIEWLWQAKVAQLENKTASIGFLFRLAQIQADELVSEVPLDKFSPTDLVVCETLQKEKFLRMKKSEGTIDFIHDLYGDWSRQRVLLAHRANLLGFINNRLGSILWHRALRLFSLHVLEQNPDISEWKSWLHAFAFEKENRDILQTLFVEAVIHTPDAFSYLEKIWDELYCDDGQLLRRLLYLCSETRYDCSHPLNWLPMLQFLYTHRDQVIELAPNEVATIAKKWLVQNQSPSYQKEAAELGLAVAWRVFHRNHRYTWYTQKSVNPKTAYRAVLASVPVLPEQATEFALIACGRQEPPPPPPELIEPAKPMPERDPNLPTPPLGSCYPEVEIPPWPDGPKWGIDRHFRDVCLNESEHLVLLIARYPEIARELILALLIKGPGKRPEDWQINEFYCDYELQDKYGWFPPFYNKGPFLIFLSTHAKIGLNVILRLVNFATEQWKDRRKAQSEEIPFVTIPFPDGKEKWFGERRLYTTYRDSTLFPDVIVSALMALEHWIYTNLDKEDLITEVIDTILKQTQSLAFAGVLIGIGKKHPALFKGQLKPFLAVPEFYSWEMRHQLDGERHHMIGWDLRRYTENQIKQAHEWHTMPHRKLELSTVALSLFLNDEDIRKFIENVREQWQIRLQNSEPDDPLYDRLTKLIREFDANNWKQEEHPEYGTIWVFYPPKEFLEEREKASREFADQQLLISFPFQCRERLHKNQPLESEKLATFWNTLQYIAQFTEEQLQGFYQASRRKEFDILDDPSIRIRDALCAGAAVLIQFHRGWLREHPENEEWCLKTLIETIQSPPPPSPVDSETSVYDMNWDNFCAYAIPVLWAEEPESGLWRSLVVRLVRHYHYLTVKILFGQAVKYRHQLGDDFLRLQNLILHLAWARWQLSPHRYAGGESELEQKAHDARVWVRTEKIFEAFIEGTLSTELPSWEEVATVEYKPPRFQSKKHWFAHSPGLDLNVIRYAFDGFPSLAEVHDGHEKQSWIKLWKEVLDWVLRMLGNGNEEITTIDGTPGEFESWVFERVAQIIPYLHSSEEQQTFWKPILSLGIPAHYWIESFLLDWFIYGIGADQCESVCIQVWKEMLDFAFTSPKWDYNLIKNSHELEELWYQLMGLHSGFLDLWNEEKKTIITHMRDYYERWAPLHLFRGYNTSTFIAFLLTPAAQNIRMDGLLWLDQAASETKTDFQYEQVALPGLLTFCWQNHRIVLRQHSQYWDAFMRLLNHLVRQGNNMASALFERISSESTR